MIPTRDDCLALMSQSGMLDHIVEHSLQVAKVALFLSVALNQRGQTINSGLVEAAALLHDLTKTESFKTKEDHAVSGSRFLKELGYERVGKVVEEHIQLTKENDSLSVTEEEVVNYADKRVRHTRIVSLQERFEDLMDRYGNNQKAFEMLEAMRKTTLETEKKIFSFLEFGPDRLEALSSDVGASIEGALGGNRTITEADHNE